MPTHPFDTLQLANGAKLIFTPCPGTKDASLEQAVAALKEAGVSHIISVMFDTEMEKLNALTLPDTAKAQEINWLQWPVSDEAGPETAFEDAYNASIAQVLEALANKETIAVHCKGGSGRTGLAIALILKAMGMANEEIISKVQALRPKALKHPVQLAYFKSFVPYSK